MADGGPPCVCYETGESNYVDCVIHGAPAARVALKRIQAMPNHDGVYGHFKRQDAMDEWLNELITPMLNDISRLMPGDAYDGDAGMDYLVLVWVRDLISGSPERVYRALGIDLGGDE